MFMWSKKDLLILPIVILAIYLYADYKKDVALEEQKENCHIYCGKDFVWQRSFKTAVICQEKENTDSQYIIKGKKNRLSEENPIYICSYWNKYPIGTPERCELYCGKNYKLIGGEGGTVLCEHSPNDLRIIMKPNNRNSEENPAYVCRDWIKYLDSPQEGCEKFCGENYELIRNNSYSGICQERLETLDNYNIKGMESFPSEMNPSYMCHRYIKQIKPTQKGCEYYCGKNYKLASDRENPGVCQSDKDWISSVHFGWNNDASDDPNYVCRYPRRHECEKYCGNDFHYIRQDSPNNKTIECYTEEPLIIKDHIEKKETVGVEISDKPIKTEDGIKYKCMRIEIRDMII